MTGVLVLATRNVHKIREFRAMLKGKTSFDLYSCLDFPTYVQAEETGKTFEETAIAKAVHAAQALGHLVLADDSGLVVPAIGGAPGVFSARYAGPDATDAENRHKLLAEMAHIQEVGRQAYFECALALASPDGLKKVVRGVCEGMILTKERGGSGFGYDPLFVKHEYSKTFGELEAEIKNRISHRRKALDRLMPILEQVEL
jgi:XTP/dITP diphosphohydrolase